MLADKLMVALVSILRFPGVRDGAVTCSPDEWVREAPRLIGEGWVQLVRLDTVPDGLPWDNDHAPQDPMTGTFRFKSLTELTF